MQTNSEFHEDLHEFILNHVTECQAYFITPQIAKKKTFLKIVLCGYDWTSRYFLPVKTIVEESAEFRLSTKIVTPLAVKVMCPCL